MSSEKTTREQLLDQGMRLATEKGLRGLVVREVAAQAGANPGSFVYYFGTRERFIAELVERWYEPVYAQLKLVARAITTTVR